MPIGDPTPEISGWRLGRLASVTSPTSALRPPRSLDLGCATASPPIISQLGVPIMDKDRIKGAVKQVVGRVKEAVGQAVGDKKTEEDGKAEQIVGKAQNAVGSVKDTLRGILKR